MSTIIKTKKKRSRQINCFKAIYCDNIDTYKHVQLTGLRKIIILKISKKVGI